MNKKEILKEDPLDEIFTRTITLKEYKELENLIDEYRKLYAKAVLVRERQFIDMLNERQELLDLIFKLNKRLEELKIPDRNKTFVSSGDGE